MISKDNKSTLGVDHENQSNQNSTLGKLVKGISKTILSISFQPLISMVIGAWAVFSLVRLYPVITNHPLVYAIVFTVVFFGASGFSGVIISTIKKIFTSTENLQSKKQNIWIRFIFPQVILPIIISLTIALLPIQGDTILTRGIRYIQASGDLTFSERIQPIVTNSKMVGTKVAGVSLLSELQTQTALSQIASIVEENKAYLQQPIFYNSLVNAFVLFGPKSERYLHDLLETNRKKIFLTQRVEPGSLFNEYLGNSFYQLKEHLNLVKDENKKYRALLKVREIEQQTESNFNAAEIVGIETKSSNSVIDLVFDALWKLEGIEDHGLSYELARQVAADASFSEVTRAKALRVVAKLGTKNDYEVLLPYLDSDSEILQTSALNCIKILHAKIKGIKPDPNKSFEEFNY
jgi:hypothetical protein